LSNRLVLEGHESESSTKACIDVLENDCALNGSELQEMLLQIFICELKVKTTDKDLRLWILEHDFIFLPVLGVDVNDHIRVWLAHALERGVLRWLAILGSCLHRGIRWVVGHRRSCHLWWLAAGLWLHVVIRRFDVNLLVIDDMSTLRRVDME